MLNERVLGVVLLGLLLAGCASPGGTRQASTASASPSTSATSSTAAPPVTLGGNGTASPHAIALVGQGCAAIDARAEYPATTAPGDVPPGWEPPLYHDETNVYDSVWICHRLRLGPFDGPMAFVLDAQDKAIPPGSCTTGYAGLRVLVEGAWFNDTAVEAWAKSALALPANSTTTRETVAPATPATTAYTFAWRPDGAAAESSITSTTTGNLPETGDNTARYFWRNGQGISYIDLKETGQQLNNDDPVLTGSVNAPMLYAQPVARPYLGEGNLFPTVDITGDVHAFKDLACKEPV